MLRLRLPELVARSVKNREQRRLAVAAGVAPGGGPRVVLEDSPRKTAHASPAALLARISFRRLGGEHHPSGLAGHQRARREAVLSSFPPPSSGHGRPAFSVHVMTDGAYAGAT